MIKGKWLRYNITSSAFSINNAGVHVRNIRNTGAERRTVAAFLSYRCASVQLTASQLTPTHKYTRNFLQPLDLETSTQTW